jgi:LytS/YehU family sensor histidine kinase
MKFRIAYHLAFWGSFTLLFSIQNPGSTLSDYLHWFSVLGVCAAVVYINLYLLLPNYVFKKRYIHYAVLLSATIGLGSVALKLMFPSGSASFSLPLFQHSINLLLFVIISSSFKFFREYSRKQELLIQAENAQLKAELSLLKSQVNPHFLFNTLNNLYGLIGQHQNQKASEVTLKLADLMRYLLHSSKSDKTSLNAEIEFIEEYLTLEKIRLSNQADIRFEHSGIGKDILVAPLLFIPLVENAFKHGLLSISKEHFAHFSLSLQGDTLFFQATNSIGVNPNKPSDSGTGLAGLKKRLKLMYPDKHRLDIEQTETVYKVTLQLHL